MPFEALDATGRRLGAQVTDPAGFVAVLGELEDSLVGGSAESLKTTSGAPG